ncbi:hypothetical protein DFJ77DRAFT_512262 [Powellomyces hirtus]|nr:hypothetical protein DFJ77DRAFT_512262 [Powellomyces hirtus]
MFSNLSKALAASREAIGSTAQTFIKEQTGLELPGSGRATPRGSQSTSHLFDAPPDDDGFREQSLASRADESGSGGTQNGADLMQFPEGRQSVDLLGPADTTLSGRDSVDGGSRSSTPVGKAAKPQSTQPGLSSMTPEQALSMDPAEMGATLSAAKEQVEGVIASHTPVSKIASNADVEAFDVFLMSLKEKQEVTVAELTRLNRRTKLLSREEEINRLKNALQRHETPPGSPRVDVRSASTPGPPVSSPASSDNTVSLKLKVRELTNALNRVKEDRDAANSRCQQLEKSLADRPNGAESSSAEVVSPDGKDDLSVEQLRARVEEAEAQRANAEADMKKQQAHVQELEAERDALSAAVKRLEIANGRIPSPNGVVHDLMSDDPIPNSQTDEAELVDLRMQISALRSQRDSTQTSMEQAKSRLATLESELADQTNAKNELAAKYASLQDEKQYQSTVDQKHDLEKKVSQLEQQLSASTQELAAARTAHDDKTSNEFHAVQAELRQREDQIVELQNKLDNASAEISKLVGALESVETMNADLVRLRSSLAECEDRLATAKSETVQAVDTISKLRAEMAATPMAETQAKLDATTADLNSSQAEMRDAKARLEEALQTRDTAHKQIVDLEEALA